MDVSHKPGLASHAMNPDWPKSLPAGSHCSRRRSIQQIGSRGSLATLLLSPKPMEARSHWDLCKDALPAGRKSLEPEAMPNPSQHHSETSFQKAFHQPKR